MRIPGLRTLNQSARWLRSRFVSHGLILGYHRVAEVDHDPYALCVSPRHFAAQLEVLQRHANLMHLAHMVEALQQGILPKRSVALTFDDGYADMLYQVKPLLEAHQIPATFFIITGQPGGVFWWNTLEKIISAATEIPNRVPFVTEDGNVTWNEASRALDRQSLLSSLYKQLLPLSSTVREQAMDQLCDWAGSAPEQAKERAMTTDELVKLAAGNLVTIGAHTVTHPMLAALPATDQAAEIRQSKRSLEETLAQPVTCFSYPNGSQSSATVSLVRESGFQCACTSNNDIIWRGSDIFQLPRFWIPNCDGPTFSRWLEHWLPNN